MRKVTVESVAPDDPDVDRRRLADPLGATHLAVNRYRLPPGERLAGLHAHGDQEEVFVVTEGRLTFETLGPGSDGEADEVAVASSEAIRFPPGTFQSGKNDSDTETAVYALGAPRDTEDLRVPVACPACEHPETRPVATDDGEALACPNCGADTDAACPECGSGDVRAVLDGETPVSACQRCGAEWPAR